MFYHFPKVSGWAGQRLDLVTDFEWKRYGNTSRIFSGNIHTTVGMLTEIWQAAGGRLITDAKPEAIVSLPLRSQSEVERSQPPDTLSPDLFRLTTHKGEQQTNFGWAWDKPICAAGDIALIGFSIVPTEIWRIAATGQYLEKFDNSRSLSTRQRYLLRLALHQLFSAGWCLSREARERAWQALQGLPVTLALKLWDWLTSKEEKSYSHGYDDQLQRAVNELAGLTTDEAEAASFLSRLQSATNWVFATHADSPTKPEKAFRKWDGRTPSGVHPTWAAMTILHEPLLSEEIRRQGAFVLLFHDILEDTTIKKLPAWVPEDTQKLVADMTFAGMEDEMARVWTRGPLVCLLKLYDKVSNLLDGQWLSSAKAAAYKEYTQKLAGVVEREYGTLAIVKIARAIAVPE